MPCNEPNVIIRNNKEDMPIIDSAISGDRNLITKETENISKCKITLQ
jgi:hypothetical protein